MSIVFLNKRRYYLTLVIVLILPHLYLIAQHAKVRSTISIDNSAGKISELRITECFGIVSPQSDVPTYLTNVSNLERKHSYNKELDSIKDFKTIEKSIVRKEFKHVEQLITQGVTELSVTSNFKGNIFNGGAPPDNSLAIADNGNIVSVVNCNIAYYTSQGRQIWAGSFWELYKDPSLTEIIFDPVVMYDSQYDRFIMIAVHGTRSSTSKLIVSFSKSNNPLDGWYVYKLDGNPLNNSCWLDYPKLGISNNEIFITGHLQNDLMGFSESIIYQIDKKNGYEGGKLAWVIWNDIFGDPIALVPATYGQKGNYGPGLYFVTQSPTRGNAVDLYEITSDLNSIPKITRTSVLKSEYEPSGNAFQLGTTVQLNTGDCRIQNAMYLDGTIHYVFQSDYQNSNYSGINYNQLNVKTLINRTFTYGQIGYDCTYPSLSSYSTSTTDHTVMICYLRSGTIIYPEIRAVKYDEKNAWSNSVLIKSGSTYVDAFQLDNTVRWGDYTGIAYRYNPNGPEIWLSGCYGSRQSLFSTMYNCFNTWIAQIHNSTVNVREDHFRNNPELYLFPNPAIDMFSLEFKLNKSQHVKINVHDVAGNLVHTLFNGSLDKGKNMLTFNCNAFPRGTYVVTINQDDTIIQTAKFIVE